MTGFGSVKVLDSFLDLLNADGLFADINPKNPAQESDVHHVEYFNRENVGLTPGTIMRVSTPSTASCPDGSTFPLAAGDYVICINPTRYPTINIDAGNILVRKASNGASSTAVGQVPLLVLGAVAPLQDGDAEEVQVEAGVDEDAYQNVIES